MKLARSAGENKMYVGYVTNITISVLFFLMQKTKFMLFRLHK